MKIKETVIKTIKRYECEPYEKNPRTISKENLKRLKKSIQDYGLVQPLIYNIKTKHIVGGHQRLTVLDEIYKTDDYEIPVIVVDLEIAEEVKLNVKLNNVNLQGEWETDTLLDLIKEYDLDYDVDLAFENADLEYMFNTEEITNISKVDIDEVKENKSNETDFQKVYETRTGARKQTALEKKEGTSEKNLYATDDYTLTLVFNSNSEKQDFLKKIRSNRNDYLPATLFYDIFDHKYKLKD